MSHNINPTDLMIAFVCGMFFASAVSLWMVRAAYRNGVHDGNGYAYDPDDDQYESAARILDKPLPRGGDDDDDWWKRGEKPYGDAS